MSNRRSNYPAGQLAKLDGDSFTGKTISSLRELAGDAPPETVEELKARIDGYFAFCGSHDLRPGIEALCMALHVTRKTLWQWCDGQGRASHDPEWKECCILAKQSIGAFLEQASIAGHLNPATGIFLLKNWLNYADIVTVDERANKEDTPTAAELPTF